MSRLRDRLIERLREFDVEDRPVPGRTDGFSSLVHRGREFAHFHDDHELDLKLGSRRIRELGLTQPPDSRVHPNRAPGSAWIELRLTRAADVDEIVRLVALAIAEFPAK